MFNTLATTMAISNAGESDKNKQIMNKLTVMAIMNRSAKNPALLIAETVSDY